MKKEARVYLNHIADAVDHIEKFTHHVTEEEFVGSVLVQSAVIRQFEIIGEAVKKLPAELKNKNKHIPWRDITRFRDKLNQRYFSVDLSLVWILCKRDIPSLQRFIPQLLD